MSNKLPSSSWRLIISPFAAGPWNMAVDAAILEAVGQRDVPPTLRLYGWDPPCLSLGYGQPAADADHASLTRRGWGLVRRPTGGRAILHTDELTYAVIAPPNEPRVAGSVLDSYQRLAGALLQALQLMHVPARTEEKYSLPPNSDPKGPVCFEVPSNWEITIDGKKLIGSAQVRRKSGVLQHGTLPLYGDLTRVTQALAFPNESSRTKAAARLLERATTVEAALRQRVSWEAAAEAFTQAFEQALNLTLHAGELTHAERQRAEQLVEEKYGNDAWTLRR